MNVTLTTRQLLGMLEEAYKKGIENQKNNEVNPRNQHEAVEGTLVAHLRVNE